ncbi:patatin-like phospholipase family protein [Dactylosporangium fulvum]|uniref:Patatin-like phospholipase family protein n=1 Tax=Dactylosporangium fulvum TaxID=53359 RepID=A0ABY5WC12_9ACTN|nr:patatin-like phospholipase family protein [Dactylosporangium fulvum]UWP86218.1 patatin-like phospholipase family protein [Dactylosporangium fulvum]
MTTALVLGGGGVVGVAWETGVIAGLAAAGLDLRVADLVVGTSAGSVVAAQITSGASVPELYDRQLAPPTGEIAARLGGAVLLRYLAATTRRTDRAALAHLGRSARRARTVPEAERRAVIAGRLPRHEWPTSPRLLITAVDATTGEEVVFDRDSGVDLVSAVAASCAVPVVWPTVTIGGRQYMDGGVRSAAHVDLATGHDRVVVLAPTTVSLRRSGRVATEIAALGPSVRSVLISPSPAARQAMGRNALDPARRAASAEAGLRQAAEAVDAIRAVWP